MDLTFLKVKGFTKCGWGFTQLKTFWKLLENKGVSLGSSILFVSLSQFLEHDYLLKVYSFQDFKIESNIVFPEGTGKLSECLAREGSWRPPSLGCSDSTEIRVWIRFPV